MITEFKIFESEENFENLGTNTAYWSWEDDSQTKTAEILLDKNTDTLYLKINAVWVKTGLGAGKRESDLEFVNIGNLQKPNLSLVRTLLKKHNIQKSVAASGFNIHWSDEEGNKMSLSELIQNYKDENNSNTEFKHIKSISDFKNSIKNDTIDDIELVQYSDRSYALFGLGTKQIKDNLINLGCRYNKFLTDPKTGEKRPGWIFSNNKLDKIKQLIKN